MWMDLPCLFIFRPTFQNIKQNIYGVFFVYIYIYIYTHTHTHNHVYQNITEENSGIASQEKERVITNTQFFLVGKLAI